MTEKPFREGRRARQQRLSASRRVYRTGWIVAIAVLGLATASAFSLNFKQTGRLRLGANLPARLAQSGGGKTFYVDGSHGSDSNSGSARAPWKTINKALATVPRAGSIIRVRPGTYLSSGSNFAIKAYNFKGNTSNPVTLMAATPGTVTISNADPKTATMDAWIYGSTGLRIEGFTFTLPTVSDLNTGSPDEVLIEKSSRIELYHNTFNESARIGVNVRGGGVNGQTANDIWILSNIFRPAGTNIFAQVTGLGFTRDQYFGSKGSHWIYAGQVGDMKKGYSYRSGSERLVIADNIFTGSPAGRDVELGPQARRSFVVNNTFFGNHSSSVIGWSTLAAYGGEGLVFFADTRRSTPFSTRDNIVTNNIFDDLDGHAVYGSGPAESGNVVEQNLAFATRNGASHNGDPTTPYLTYGHDGTSDSIFSTGTGNLPEESPLFVDPRAWNFHLQRGSPAAGAGNPAYTYPYDVYGRARLRPDLGAVASGRLAQPQPES